MKNFLMVLFLIVGIFIFFIPYNTKVNIFETIGIESSFLGEPKIEEKAEKEKVINLKFNENNKTEYTGNISTGEMIKDLSWGPLPGLPFVKCFDESDNYNFNGNIVLHRILLGKNKTAKIGLIKDNKDSYLTMFIYKTDALNKIFPPEEIKAYDCKNSIGQDGNQEIEMKGNTVTSDIVIGIAGGNGLLEGGYTLELEEK